MRSDVARDDAAIADIAERARRATERIAPVGLDRFMDDMDAQDIAVRCLEVIGEAAGRVSDAGRAARPGVPWSQMIGMRHRLIHDYGRLDLLEVWRTIAEDLPALIAELERPPRS